MRRLHIAIFLLLFIAFCMPVAASATDTSVGGISTSMGPEEIRAKLGDKFSLAQTAHLQRGEVFNFIKDKEGYNVMTLGPKVIYIEHQQFFAPDEEISAAELTKALKAKYGAPSLSDASVDNGAVWIVGSDGPLGAAHADEARNCVAYDVKGPTIVASGKLTFDFGFPNLPLKDSIAQCGVVIQAKPSFSAENPGLITHLTVTVFDVPAAEDWYKAAMIEYNKKLGDEVEAHKNNKPNL